MPDSLSELRVELARANRILANEGIIDAFGHISVRHPDNPQRYFISRHRASELVEPSDILEMTLDSEPVVPTSVRLYSEMVIHGEIYKARPDVSSVCHHHAMAVLPFCATGVELVPLFHLGGTLGGKVPFWDSRDEFGDTNLLVRTPEEGASLARALGPHFIVLLRRHGAAARRQDPARMRVPLDLHHAQCRAAAARHGDRNAGAAHPRRNRADRRPQYGHARHRAGLGILERAPAEGRSHLGGERPADGHRQRAAASRRRGRGTEARSPHRAARARKAKARKRKIRAAQRRCIAVAMLGAQFRGRRYIRCCACRNAARARATLRACGVIP